MELDQVVRQEQDSGILINATIIRESIEHAFYENFKFDLKGLKTS